MNLDYPTDIIMRTAAFYQAAFFIFKGVRTKCKKNLRFGENLSCDLARIYPAIRRKTDLRFGKTAGRVSAPAALTCEI